MLPLRRPAAMFALLLAAAALARAAEWKIPPITGEMEGDFTPLKVAGTPKLHWTVTARDVGTGDRDLDIAVDGPGARLRATARLDVAGNGNWHVTDAEFDLGPWFAAFAPPLLGKGEGLSIAGALHFSGEGTWRDGQCGGRGVFTLRDGRIDDPAHKLLLEGVTLELAFDDFEQRRSPAGQVLTWQAGHYDVLALGAGRMEFALVPGGVRVERAVLQALAGEFAVGGFEFAWAKPEFTVQAEVRGAEMAMLVPLLPSIVAEAQGKLDGTISLHRDEHGIEIGVGRLGLRAGESARLRLTPSPGLLSTRLPAAVKKYYPGLGDLEAGRVPLKAEQLDISFTPSGDAEGRTATVHVAGGPEDPRMRAPVDLVVNVRGPLDTLVKLGTASRLRFR